MASAGTMGASRCHSVSQPTTVAASVLPWKDTPQHWELMEIVLKQRPEYGRVHYPDQVRALERKLGLIE